MSRPTYSSNNQEALLQSTGPYRVTLSDQSIGGYFSPSVEAELSPVVTDVTEVYGIQLQPRELILGSGKPESRKET